MYKIYESARVVTKTQTNIRLMLDDPKKRDGKFTYILNFIVDGTMEVHTQKQFVTTQSALGVAAKGPSVGEICMLPWWIGEMGPSKTISALGEITVRGNPALVSTGVIRQDAPSLAFPATLEASVFQMFEIPGYGMLHNKFPVLVDAVVDQIPPFYALGACRCAILFDEDNVARGMAAGRSLTFMGLA